MKPTPGPWEINDDSQRIDGLGDVRMYRVLAPNGDVVAEFSNTGCSEIVYEAGRHYDFLAMANATLIAAAPDMYAVLSRLLDHKEPFVADDVAAAAKAALAKARGECSQ